MTETELTHYASWASIVSLAISIVSLLYVRSIKANIVRFRRRQRIRQIVEEVQRIPDDAVPLAPASKSKIASLKRNVPNHLFLHFTAKGRAALELQAKLGTEDLLEIKDAMQDWLSYSEET